MELHKKIMVLEGWPEKLRDCVCLHTNASHSPCDPLAAFFDTLLQHLQY